MPRRRARAPVVVLEQPVDSVAEQVLVDVTDVLREHAAHAQRAARVEEAEGEVALGETAGVRRVLGEREAQHVRRRGPGRLPDPREGVARLDPQPHVLRPQRLGERLHRRRGLALEDPSAWHAP